MIKMANDPWEFNTRTDLNKVLKEMREEASTLGDGDAVIPSNLNAFKMKGYDQGWGIEQFYKGSLTEEASIAFNDDIAKILNVELQKGEAGTYAFKDYYDDSITIQVAGEGKLHYFINARTGDIDGFYESFTGAETIFF